MITRKSRVFYGGANLFAFRAEQVYTKTVMKINGYGKKTPGKVIKLNHLVDSKSHIDIAISSFSLAGYSFLKTIRNGYQVDSQSNWFFIGRTIHGKL